MSSNLQKSGTNALLLALSKVITLLLSMATAMILARTLSLDEYGTYSELLTISSIGVSIFSLGLPNALNYFLPRCQGTDEKRKFIGFYFILITVLSVVLMGAMACCNHAIATYYDNPLLITYSYFLLIVPWTKLIISSRSNLLVAGGYVVREIVYAIANGLLLAVIALLTIVNQNNFDIYIELYVVVECLFAGLAYLEAYRISEKKIKINIDWNAIKELLKYTIPLGLSTAVSTINLDLDKLIIGSVMDEASVAIYANAGKELPFSLISTSFTAIFLPQIVLLIKDKKIDRAVKRWKDIMVINYIILVFCVAASIVFAPQIISLLYSEAYLDGVGIFRIYSLTLLLRITYWAMILNAYGRTKEILYNSVACLAINVCLNYLLYNLIGFTGPAYATIISIFVIAALQIVRTSKLLKIPVRQIIPFKQFILPTVACVVSGVAVWLITHFSNISTGRNGVLMAVAIGIVWAGIYFLIFGKKILALWRNLNQDIQNKEV